MKNKNKIHGAGLIVISRDLRKVLTLWSNGKLDLPKGAVEKTETSLDAAFREGFEEAGIRKEDCEFLSDMPGVFDNMHFYYVFWNGQVNIVPNPKTGILEHDTAVWMPWRKAIESAPVFLKAPLFHGKALTAIIPRRRK